MKTMTPTKICLIRLALQGSTSVQLSLVPSLAMRACDITHKLIGKIRLGPKPL